jgi:hypothetical protein
MTRTAMRSACGALSLVAVPAHAHLIETGLGPIYDGVLHFALTPEDVAPTLALALFAGLRGAAHGRAAMLTLPAAWFVTGCIGIAAAGLANDIALGAVAWLPLLLFGGLAAGDVRVSHRVTMILAIALGAFLGFENGATMAPPGPGLSGLAGVVTCAFVVVALTAALVASRETQLMRTAARVIGSWIAASGVLLLGWSFR